MRTNLLVASLIGAMVLAVNGCSSQSSTTDGEMIDQSVAGAGGGNGALINDQGMYEDQLGYGGLEGDAVTSIDATGTLVIGDPNAQPNAPYDPTFAGPQALRDNNTIYFRYDKLTLSICAITLIRASLSKVIPTSVVPQSTTLP